MACLNHQVKDTTDTQITLPPSIVDSQDNVKCRHFKRGALLIVTVKQVHDIAFRYSAMCHCTIRISKSSHQAWSLHSAISDQLFPLAVDTVISVVVHLQYSGMTIITTCKGGLVQDPL